MSLLFSFSRLETEVQRHRESAVPQAAQLTSCPAHKLPSLQMQLHVPHGQRARFPDPRAWNLPLSLPPLQGPISLCRGRTNFLQWPSAGGTQKASHPTPQAPQAPPNPLAPHHLVLVRDQCPYQLHHFPGPGADIPRAPHQPDGHGFAAAPVPPSSYLMTPRRPFG